MRFSASISIVLLYGLIAAGQTLPAGGGGIVRGSRSSRQEIPPPPATLPALDSLSQIELLRLRQSLGVFKPIASLDGHEDGVLCVAFSPDGRLLASGSGDGIIKLWSIGTKKEITTLRAHTGSIRAIQFSPDGQFLLSSSADKSLILWNANTYEIDSRYAQLQLSNVVGFLPDSKHFVSTSGNDLLLYARGDEKAVSLTVPGLNARYLDVTPSGQVVVGSSPPRVLLWNPLDPASPAGKIVKDHERPESGTEARPFTNVMRSVRALKDGAALIVDSGAIWKWNLATDDIQLTAAPNVNVSWLLTPYHDDQLFMYINASNLISANAAGTSTITISITPDIHAIAVSPGNVLALAHGGTWDAAGAWIPSGPTSIELFDLSQAINYYTVDSALSAASAARGPRYAPDPGQPAVLPWK